METMKAIARRKSIRSYKQDQISDEALNTVLTAGCAAPVGMGRYNTLHLTVIQDKEILKRISAGGAKVMNMDGDLLYGAPTLVLVSTNDESFPGCEYANAGCILENMMLAATDQKVDSCIIWGTALAVNADVELRGRLRSRMGLSLLQVLRLDMLLFPMKQKRNLK